MLSAYEKRGLSTIVATLLVILLTLVAVGIIWVVVKNVIKNGAEQVSLGKFTLDLEIEQVRLSGENDIIVTLKRNPGEGEISGLVFIVESKDNSETFIENVSMEELEKRTFTFTLENINQEEITKIKVAPIFLLESGKEVIGDVKYTWKPAGETNIPACTPNCVGRTCGGDGCSGSCGTCSIGTCNSTGQCVVGGCTPGSCAGRVCGSIANGTCSGTLNCGTCSTGTCNSTGQCVVNDEPSIQTGLVSWWKFDGNAIDSVGDNDGTINGVTTTSIGCKAGQCYSFSGINQNIVVPNSNTLNFPTGGTVSLWVNALTSVGSYDMPIWRGGSSNGMQGYDLELGTGAWYANLANGTASKICRYSPSPLTGLHMLTFTFNLTGGLICYVDGVNSSAPISTVGFGGVTSPYELYIGSGESNNYEYNGSIDEIMIWNRPLNSTEVNFLYNSFDYGSAPSCVENSYSQCYLNDVYWYNSCGSRGSIRYDCNSTQTCTSSICVNNPPSATGSVILGHTNTDITQIPLTCINKVKRELIIAYQHTSHGQQIVGGLNGLESYNSLYSWTDSASNTSDLTLDDYAMNTATSYDLGYEDGWAPATRNYLAAHPDTNVILWSWCSITGHNITKYLLNMQSLIMEYPNVHFAFITGHAEGGGEYDDSDTANRQIRNFVNNDAFCDTHECILFDFSDIENYDPDGNYYLDKRVEDGLQYDCVLPYNDGAKTCTWSEEWMGANPGSLSSNLVNNYINDCSHSPEVGESPTCELNCALKGQAAWWMFARMVGWDGIEGHECT